MSIMHDWKSARRLSVIKKESGLDNQTGYRWIYGIKTKDETIKIVKQWYSNIADLRARQKLVVVMRDNAGENKSQEIPEFF